MKYSKRTKMYADEIVNCYAEWDKMEECYDVDFDKISEDYKIRLAYCVYSDNPDKLIDACGAENDNNHKMTAALLVMMDHQSNEAKDNFIEIWMTELILYVEKFMIQLLEDALIDYNHEMENPEQEPE